LIMATSLQQLLDALAERTTAPTTAAPSPA